MASTTLLPAILALLPGFQSPAAPPTGASVGLRRALDTLRAADRDHDGAIALGEAIRAKIPARDFGESDYDRDLELSRDEFVLYYRNLLLRAEKPVAADLELEAARLQAARRLRAGEKAGEKAARVTIAPPSPSEARAGITSVGPAGSRFDVRSQIEKAWDVLEAPAVSSAPPPQATGAAAPAQPALAAPAAIPSSAAATPATVHAVSAPTDGLALGQPETGGDQGEQPLDARQRAAAALERARGLLQRLVADKRLAPKEARDFYLLLRERALQAVEGGKAEGVPDECAVAGALERVHGTLGRLRAQSAIDVAQEDELRAFAWQGAQELASESVQGAKEAASWLQGMRKRCSEVAAEPPVGAGEEPGPGAGEVPPPVVVPPPIERDPPRIEPVTAQKTTGREGIATEKADRPAPEGGKSGEARAGQSEPAPARKVRGD